MLDVSGGIVLVTVGGNPIGQHLYTIMITYKLNARDRFLQSLALHWIHLGFMLAPRVALLIGEACMLQVWMDEFRWGLCLGQLRIRHHSFRLLQKQGVQNLKARCALASPTGDQYYSMQGEAITCRHVCYSPRVVVGLFLFSGFPRSTTLM